MNNNHRRSNGSWNEKTMKQKAAARGIALGIFLACAIAVYAMVQLWGSKSVTVNNTRGHVFEFEVSGAPGIEVIPGSEQSLTPSVTNKSTTDDIYCFMGFDFDENLYEITEVDGWEIVENQGGHIVYSYSSNNTMNEVAMGESAVFSGKLKCIATGEVFQLIADDDFAVDVTGYAISTSICDVNNSAAWQKYQDGGN